MSAERKSQHLIAMPLKRETDVVLSRNRARLIAKGLHFDRASQARIATAVSEIARNAFRYARSGTATFSLVTEAPNGPKAEQWLSIEVADEGPGITDLESILAGTYRSSTGMGAGLRGAKRLLERVEIATSAGGTKIELLQRLPRGRTAGADEVRTIIAELAESQPADPLEELMAQN